MKRFDNKLLLTGLVTIFVLLVLNYYIPVASKSVADCGSIDKTRYSILMGQEEAYNDATNSPASALQDCDHPRTKLKLHVF
jgi:hypothetical protein